MFFPGWDIKQIPFRKLLIWFTFTIQVDLTLCDVAGLLMWMGMERFCFAPWSIAEAQNIGRGSMQQDISSHPGRNLLFEPVFYQYSILDRIGKVILHGR